MTEKADVYTRVTNKILADLERGNLTWHQPWQAGHQAGPVSRPLRAGGQAYRGINVIMLWAAAMEKNYSCPLWLTYRQASELGGQVRKGEKGSLVVYANEIVRTDTDESGADVEVKIPFMKGYTVFNGEQIDGLPGHFYASRAAAQQWDRAAGICGEVFREYENRHPTRRQPRLLQRRPRHRADAGISDLPRRGIVFRDARA